MTSASYTESATFTITHAKHMAAKVAADLKRIQRLYKGEPSDLLISWWEEELIELLKEGVLAVVAYGYQRNGDWIEPTVRYTEQDLLGGLANDDDPGRIRANADISNASFTSFLTYNGRWNTKSSADREAIKRRFNLQRGYGNQPGVQGYFESDRSYSAGGRALNRATVRTL